MDISAVAEESRKCLSQSETRSAIFLSDPPEKHKLGRGRRVLAYYQALSIPFIDLEEKPKKSKAFRGLCCHLCFPNNSN